MSNYRPDDCEEPMAIPAMDTNESSMSSVVQQSEHLHTVSVRGKGKGKKIVIHTGDGDVCMDNVSPLCLPAMPGLEVIKIEKEKKVHIPELKVMAPRRDIFEAKTWHPLEKPSEEQSEPNIDEGDFCAPNNMTSLLRPQQLGKRRCSSPTLAVGHSTPEKVLRRRQLKIISGPNTQFHHSFYNDRKVLVAVAPLDDARTESDNTEFCSSDPIDTPLPPEAPPLPDTPPPPDRFSPCDEMPPPETSLLPSHIPQSVQGLAEEDIEVQSNEDDEPLDLSFKAASNIGKREADEMDVGEDRETSYTGLQMDGSEVGGIVANEEPIPAGVEIKQGNVPQNIMLLQAYVKLYQSVSKNIGPAMTQRLLGNAIRASSITSHMQPQSVLGAVADRFYGRPAGSTGQQPVVIADPARLHGGASSSNTNHSHTPPTEASLSSSIIPTAFLQDQELIGENGQLHQTNLDVTKARLHNKLLNKKGGH